MVSPGIDVAVHVLLDCGVQPFGDPLAVLDYDGLEAVQSNPGQKA